MLALVFSVLCAWFCYKLAQKQNRNTIIASVCGFFFSILTVIVYLVLGELDKRN